VAVRQLFRCGVPQGQDFDVEVQRLASERVVEVHQHLVLADVHDRRLKEVAVLVTHVQHEARLQLQILREEIQREGLQRVFIIVAVGIYRGDHHVLGLVDGHAGQGALQAGDDVVRAVQVQQRIVRRRLVNDFAVVQLQRVLHTDDQTILNLVGGHDGSLLSP